MQCHEVQELLSAYLDGMLDPSQKDGADRHLEQCPACRSELDVLKMVVGLVRDLPPMDPPAEFRQELRRRLEQEAGPRREGDFLAGLVRGRWSGIFAAAASFVLVIGLAAHWYGVPGKYAARDQGGPVESYAVKDKTAQEGGYPGPGENRAFPEGHSRYDVSGPPASTMVLGHAGASQEGQTGRDSVTTTSGPPAPLKGVADVTDESVQIRKIAAGNGVSVMAARGAAVPPVAGAEQPKQAAVEVKVGDRTRAAREVFGIAQKLGGMAAVLPGTDGREVIMRVPADQFEKALADIGKTGRVIRQDYLQDEKVDLLKSAAQSTGISPGEQPSATEGGPAMATIRVRLE